MSGTLYAASPPPRLTLTIKAGDAPVAGELRVLGAELEVEGGSVGGAVIVGGPQEQGPAPSRPPSAHPHLLQPREPFATLLPP